MSEFCVFSCVQMQFASTQVFRHTNLSLQWSAPLRQTIHNRCGGRSHRSRDDINGGNSLTKDYRPNHGWRWWSCNCKFLLNIRRIFCCAWARYVTSTTALCMDQEIKKYNIYIYCLFIYFYLFLYLFIYLYFQCELVVALAWLRKSGVSCRVWNAANNKHQTVKFIHVSCQFHVDFRVRCTWFCYWRAKAVYILVYSIYVKLKLLVSHFQ